MIKHIPNTDSIYIDNDGKIYQICNTTHEFTELLLSTRFKIGGKEVQLIFNNSYTWCNLFWLTCLAMTETNFVNAAAFVWFEYAWINKNTKVLRTVFKIPQYYDNDKLYRIVPGYSTIAINKNGTDIIRVEDDKHLTIRTNIYGYHYADVYDPLVLKQRSIQVHLLVALAWIENKDIQNNVVVNHIDGNKLNNSIENLEWCSQQYNMRHAADNNLVSTGVPCKVRDIATGKIYTFPTMAAAVKFMDVEPSRVRFANLLNDPKFNKLINGRYEIRELHDKKPWLFKNNVNPASISRDVRYIFVIFDDINDTLEIVNGVHDLIDKYKLNDCNRKAKDLLIEFKKRYSNLRIELIDQYISETIEIKNILTNSIHKFNNVDDAARFVNKPRSYMLTMARSNGTNLYDDKYQVRYQSPEEWPINPKPISMYDKHDLTITVTNTITKETKIYNTFKAVEHDCKIDRGTIKRHAKDNTVFKNYLFKLEYHDGQ